MTDSNILKFDFPTTLKRLKVVVRFSRFCELSEWLSSQKRQVRLLGEAARNSSHEEQVNAVQVS